jgi:hypothetical protein
MRHTRMRHELAHAAADDVKRASLVKRMRHTRMRHELAHAAADAVKRASLVKREREPGQLESEANHKRP